jgi:hypothetical protein
MESRNRIGEAAGTGQADGEKEIQSETKEEVQAEGQANEEQPVIAGLMVGLPAGAANCERMRARACSTASRNIRAAGLTINTLLPRAS